MCIKLNIAICDDEPLAVGYVAYNLRRWAEKNQSILHISSFSSAEQFLFEYDENRDFDLLFLDIQMGEINGVELAKNIREKDEKIQIVFITALPDYISEGYDLAALHYLIKPVSEEKIFAVMDRVAQNCITEETYILVTVDQTLQRIPVSSIMYAESFAHYITITAKNGVYQVRVNAGTLAEKLKNGFVRPHRSYLVNLRYVHSISKTDILMDDGTIIPLSRYNYKNVNQAFIEYYRGRFNNETF